MVRLSSIGATEFSREETHSNSVKPGKTTFGRKLGKEDAPEKKHGTKASLSDIPRSSQWISYRRLGGKTLDNTTGTNAWPRNATEIPSRRRWNGQEKTQVPHLKEDQPGKARFNMTNTRKKTR